MIEIKESDLVEGFFWNDKEISKYGRLLCKKPIGGFNFVSINDNGVVTTWKNFEPKKEPEYVPWESVDEIPEEFWNGWVTHRDRTEKCAVLGFVYRPYPGKDGNCPCVIISASLENDYFLLENMFKYLTWSPTFNGEYKPCGKVKGGE